MARNIKQVCIPNDENSTGFTGIIYSIGIHALPGTEFKINNNENAKFIVGPSGNFSMNFENNPISSIEWVSSPLNTVTYPTIIDIIYEDGGKIQ